MFPKDTNEIKGYREIIVDFGSDMWNVGVIYEKNNICTDNSAKKNMPRHFQTSFPTMI